MRNTPPKYLTVLQDFLSESTTEDALHDMILCCCEAWSTSDRKAAERARRAIAEHIKKQKRDAKLLYNRRRNISLEQNYGDTKTPAEEMLNLTGWREWE